MGVRNAALLGKQVQYRGEANQELGVPSLTNTVTMDEPLTSEPRSPCVMNKHSVRPGHRAVLVISAFSLAEWQHCDHLAFYKHGLRTFDEEDTVLL